MITPGPYLALGKVVRQARLDQGYCRRWLVRRIVDCWRLEVTTAGATIMVRELEVDGLAMNDAVVEHIIAVLGIPTSDVADLLALARAESAAEFAAELKSFAKTMAKDQGRPEREILTGLAHLVETQQGRPLV